MQRATTTTEDVTDNLATLGPTGQDELAVRTCLGVSGELRDSARATGFDRVAVVGEGGGIGNVGVAAGGELCACLLNDCDLSAWVGLLGASGDEDLDVVAG